MTVRTRIVGAFVAMVMVLLTFVTIFVPRRLAKEHGESLRRSATAVLVVLRGQIVEGSATQDVLAASLARMGDAPDIATVTLFGADGEELMHVGPRPEGLASLDKRGHLTFEDDHFVVVQDQVALQGSVGALRVVMSRAGFTRQMKEFRPTQVLVSCVIALVGALFGLMVSRIVVRPIEELTAGVKAVERGEEKAIDLGGSSEVVELAEAINRMRTDLNASYKELARAAKKARIRADKLEQANVELDSFAYAASHDLRAPLRGIAHLSEFIAEDVESVEGISKETRENLETLKRRVQRLDTLLMSLLEYSRAGRVDADSERVNMQEVVDEVVDLLAVPDGYVVEAVDDLPVIESPRAPIERVFVHLIGNAVKHHDKERGRIEIGYNETADFHVFTVSDDGPGIPAAFQDKAFKIFYTLKRRDEVEGSGMGLALIKKTVESFGGRLNLESRGRGCRFIVRWPMDFDDEDQTMVNLRAASRRFDS